MTRVSARPGRRHGPDRDIKPKKDSTLAMMRAAQSRGGRSFASHSRISGPRRRAARGRRHVEVPRRPRRVVRARRALERRARAARRAADAQGPAVRHGVHLHDLSSRARRVRGLLVVNGPPASATSTRRPTRRGSRSARRRARDARRAAAARVLGRARPDRAEAARRHGRALDLPS